MSTVGPIQPPDVVQEGTAWFAGAFLARLGQAGSIRRVDHSADRLYNNVPFPDDAADIVFDDRRLYLELRHRRNDWAQRRFLSTGIAAGWTTLSTADIASRWPNAKIDETVANGAVAYFSRDVRDGGPKQQPIMLTLQGRDDGKTSVEIKIAPFMQPQNLELAKDAIGLPVPDHTAGFGSTGSSDSVRRKVEGKVAADLPVVLAFYRRELGAQSWKEEARGAVITDNDVTLYFSSADQNARLTLNHKYDLTFVTLVTEVKEAALAARAKAKKEADEKFFRDAQVPRSSSLPSTRQDGSRRRPTCRMRPCARSLTRPRRFPCRRVPRT
jgi:hypothetical protein